MKISTLFCLRRILLAASGPFTRCFHLAFCGEQWKTSCWNNLLHCSLGPGSVLTEKGEKKSAWVKKEIGEWSEPRGSLEWEKGSEAWRHAFDVTDPPSSNWNVNTQVLVKDASVSILCRFCKKKLNSRWSNSASKEIYLTSISNWSNTSFGEGK